MADQPVGDIIKAITDDVKLLVRDEVQLAKAELVPAAKTGGIGAGLLAGAAFFVVSAVFILYFCVAYVLVRLGLPVWAAFLIVSPQSDPGAAEHGLLKTDRRPAAHAAGELGGGREGQPVPRHRETARDRDCGHEQPYGSVRERSGQRENDRDGDADAEQRPDARADDVRPAADPDAQHHRDDL